MAGPIAGRRHWSDDTWSYLTDPRMPAMEHGWKLHVTARPATLDAVTALVLPVLERHVCHAKWARDQATLRALNSGARNTASVGKAVTVYPAPGELVPLAAELVELLRHHEGPPIVSDRRIDPNSPVYYRYGPFTAEYRTGRGGRLESVMTGPDGRVFDGLASAAYRCPPWAEDPFARRTPVAAPTAGFGGGRYRVTRGIARKAHGNVYRAMDRITGLPVVVKQARAYVAEDESGADTRDRLRNERAVLTRLDTAVGVPRALDYFRHRADEYLVMTSCGDRDLRRDVHTHGPYPAAESGPRSLPALARRLLHLLDGIHRSGVVVRDLKPDNVVLDADGRCHLVDFGIGAIDGHGPDGSTPGYSWPPYRTGAPAEPADDYHALGATLHFAATGLDPVILDADPGRNRELTLRCLEFALPDPACRRIRRTLAELTDPDPVVRTAGAAHLREGAFAPDPAARPAGRGRESGPSADLLGAIIEHTLARCVDEAHRIAHPERFGEAAVPAPIDLYGGASGLGLELLHHRDRPGVRATVDVLADWTARQSRTLPPGLYSGRTGVDLFLTAAGAPPRPAPPELPTRNPDGGPPEADLIDGDAGIGLGHLLLAHHHPPAADRHLAVAAACHHRLTTGLARLTPVTAPRPGDAALAQGLAHGDAGVAYFLLEYARATGDPAALGDAERACAALAAATPALLAAADRPSASRRYGSWCRGLAGIGTVLARAADCLDSPGHRALAEACARSCLALAPRMPLVTQCCGLAGVGDLMLELAPESEEFHSAAGTVAALVLARAGGPPTRPVFPDPTLTRSAFPYATGTAGVLSFLRRLGDPTAPRLGMLPRGRTAGDGSGSRARE
ncbi:class IV lanthionine synthetase LanL [Streptomyces sp. TLI_171]|uniref:class IV lanthionine synthetase LanL n=1 Tax=Streptomyces sp. TLI_171 TaxID=1938859 RepID=UPI000C18E864|nr:class IV lanthionine synthetase LanL [Streptomyces sp. TLI_171]RKE17751.1 lanthionine synthetase-like protein [Streptomyces sp. TLI_171]